MSKLAAIYVRISVDRSTEVSTAVQERACKKWAKDHGYAVEGVYLDRGKSAFKDSVKRPELDQLLSRIDAGGVDALVVYKLDRVYRSSANFGALLKRLAGKAEFVSITEGFDTTTAMGRAMIQVAAVFAELDSAMKSERVTDALQHSARAGLAHRGPRAFGYAADRTTPEPSEAAAIRDAAERVLAGETVSDIARSWNASGLFTTGGNAWRPHIVARVLLSEYLAGWRKIGTERIRGTWEPILDDATHDALVQVLGDPTRRTNGSTTVYELTGLLRCGYCGSNLHSKGGRYRRYVCSAGHGLPGCGKISAAAHLVEEEVRERVISALDPKAVKKHGEADRTTARDVERRLASLVGRRDELARMWASGELSDSERRAAADSLSEQIGSSERELEKLQSTTRLPDLPDDLAGWWSTAATADRRDVLRAVVEEVTVGASKYGGGRWDGERVVVTWRA